MKYGGYCVVDSFDALQTAVREDVDASYAAGDVPNAERVLAAYVELVDGLNALAIKTAASGTETLRRELRESLVRPEGDHRLSNALECAPVYQFGTPGIVGIADYDKLDAEAPWYPVQERGSGKMVGRVLFGAFFGPGPATRPSGAFDREHAFFQPRGREEGVRVRGSMEIHKPIPAKHFLERGAGIIEAEWKVQFDGLLANFIRKVSVPL